MNTKPVKLSNNQFALLQELCTAENGKGYMLEPADRRIAGPLLSAGYVMWLGFGKIRIYSATEKGRALVRGAVL